MKLKEYIPKGKYIILERQIAKKIGKIFVPESAEVELIPSFKVLKVGVEAKNVIVGEIIVLTSINYLNALSFEDHPETIFTCEDNNVMGGYILKD